MSFGEDPIAGVRFFITLARADAHLPPAQAMLIPLVAVGEFSQAGGLGADLEVTPYAEGGVNGYVHQLPVRHSWSRITLARGVVRTPTLWLWYLAGLTQSPGARRDGAIVLLGSDGTPAIAWAFRGGLAARWTGPELDAMQNTVAVESIEIAHHGLQQIPLSRTGAAAMMEIRNLEVRFDVDGSDEEVFARLFGKFAAQWSRAEAERRALDRDAERERALGDRQDEDA